MIRTYRLFYTFTQVIFLLISNSCFPACVLRDFDLSSPSVPSIEERSSEEIHTYKSMTCHKFDRELRCMGAYSCTPMLSLSDDAFNDNDTLKPDNISQALSQMGYEPASPVRIVQPGMEAHQIFSTTDRFFKVIKSKEEGVLLRTINLSPLSPQTKSMINLPEATFTYFRNGQFFHILVLPSAPGKSLSSWISELNNPGKLSHFLIDSFLEEVGSALAALHLELIYLDPANSDIRKLRTCIHGDLHTHNIFFDPKMLQVTFIDTAGIGASWLAPQSPELDFFLIMRSLQMEVCSKELKYLKFSRMCEAFFKGYKSKVPAFLHSSIDKVISNFTASSSRVTPKSSLNSES